MSSQPLRTGAQFKTICMYVSRNCSKLIRTIFTVTSLSTAFSMLLRCEASLQFFKATLQSRTKYIIIYYMTLYSIIRSFIRRWSILSFFPYDFQLQQILQISQISLYCTGYIENKFNFLPFSRWSRDRQQRQIADIIVLYTGCARKIRTYVNIGRRSQLFFFRFFLNVNCQH